jgi:molybdate transport repressor ModE-like protein
MTPGIGAIRAPSINLARLDLVSLHLVVHCAARGSISRAARECHLSVMGASDRLRRLEEALGKPLFHRHRHGLEPTEAGRAVLRGAAAMLAAACEVVEAVAAAPLYEAERAPNPGRRGRSRAADPFQTGTGPSSKPSLVG